jgi:adenylylsulfate kinase
LIIQIIGLPGAGKTALATALKEKINAIHINADEARATVNSDLGFSVDDRVENARRLGEIARLISKQGVAPVIVDFICPTQETREAFGRPDFLVWVDRIGSGRYEDTNLIWESPERVDIHIPDGMSVEEEVQYVIKRAHLFDWSAPATLQLGRYQPWHEGHNALLKEARNRTKQVLLGVRNTYGTSEKDPLVYEEVERRIREGIGYNGDTLVMRLPNITNIVYGRDVGYKIEYIDLPPEIQAISATQKRKDLGI